MTAMSLIAAIITAPNAVYAAKCAKLFTAKAKAWDGEGTWKQQASAAIRRQACIATRAGTFRCLTEKEAQRAERALGIR